ncbi:hypothetical protein BU26DRAFT_522839 [Trematosphaeria pertusa]|uniref:Uncharacterized protein n=1 Tax=Trematosphaeria pertusa TaxID=390896 RepID=A0A6A6I3H0_9PLEO|nr:uncharacterized protein BU26DRAFT_522839 [Trematosphaeria pertusa]KAF2244130.1 hypothetical protein BU26DRAFT_522839 [Trematosphaeria pertusa]
MPYVWDTFDTYQLRQADLESYLRTKFGPWDFYIRVCGPKDLCPVPMAETLLCR